MDLLMVSQPTGFWANIIFGLERVVENYAVAIILITLIIKLVLLPFDFLNKYITKKSTRQQAVMKPELDKIKQRYANNPDMQNKKTMELYKKEGFSMAGTCGGMLVYMLVTILIFISLLGTLNSISYYKIYQEYTTLHTEYTSIYNDEIIEGLEESEKNTLRLQAEQAVVEKYDEIKTDFIWIKNIWRPDTSASVVLSYKDFVNNIKNIVTQEEIESILEEEYTMVMTSISNSEIYGGWNGLFILSLLAAASTYASVQISNWVTKWKSRKENKVLVSTASDSAKTMTMIMPIIMGVFTLLYNSAFGIYIVTGAIFTLVTSPIVTILVDNIEYKIFNKKSNKKLVSYDRNRREL